MRRELLIEPHTPQRQEIQVLFHVVLACYTQILLSRLPSGLCQTGEAALSWKSYAAQEGTERLRYHAIIQHFCDTTSKNYSMQRNYGVRSRLFI